MWRVSRREETLDRALMDGWIVVECRREETLIEALEEGLSAIRTICLAIGEWAAVGAKPTFTNGIRTPLAGVDEKVSEIVADRIKVFNPS